MTTHEANKKGSSTKLTCNIITISFSYNYSASSNKK